LEDLPKSKRQVYVDQILTMQQKFLTNNAWHYFKKILYLIKCLTLF
jgi:hypothetical protein